jgi:hypothetical protein
MQGRRSNLMPPPGGLVLWEGPSRLDGSPIVAIATFRTDNRKTGPMIQTWIIRLGSYGDPVAVPLGVWTELLSWSGGHTGYTHQWRRPDSQDYSGILMASVETKVQREEASALGWRTYRIIGETERPGKGEITCLAAKERKMRTTCAECLLCSGSAGPANRPDITIRLHGAPNVIYSARRQLAVLNQS